MPRTIHIDGPSDDLHSALEDRLLRAGAPVSKNPDEAEISLIIGGNSQYDIIIIANDDPTKFDPEETKDLAKESIKKFKSLNS